MIAESCTCQQRICKEREALQPDADQQEVRVNRVQVSDCLTKARNQRQDKEVDNNANREDLQSAAEGLWLLLLVIHAHHRDRQTPRERGMSLQAPPPLTAVGLHRSRLSFHNAQ